MLTLLYQIQNQIVANDSMSALAAIAMGLAAFTAVSHVLDWRQTSDKWRRAAYFMGGALGLYTAGAYAYVLFVDAAANVAWLRPAVIFWMIHAMVSKHTINTVASYDPDERCQRQTEKLEEQIADHLQSINILQHNNKNYRDQLAEMKTERDKMTADATTIRKSLEDARGKLVEMLDEKMALMEEVDRLRGRH